MRGFQVSIVTRTLSYTILLFIAHFDETNGINLGLFAGDNKRHSNPLIIKKTNRNAPVFININSGIPKLAIPSLLPKVPKLPQLKLLEPKLLKVKTLSRKSPRSLRTPRIPKLPLLPLIPPILPLIPPILPLLPPHLPFIPPFPILPSLPIAPLPLFPPLLPKLPKLTNTLKPLKVPILGKTRLQKALSSEIKPILMVPAIDNKQVVLKKLLELRRQGFLTSAEYLRFKKLLIHK